MSAPYAGFAKLGCRFSWLVFLGMRKNRGSPLGSAADSAVVWIHKFTCAVLGRRVRPSGIDDSESDLCFDRLTWKWGCWNGGKGPGPSPVWDYRCPGGKTWRLKLNWRCLVRASGHVVRRLILNRDIQSRRFSSRRFVTRFRS